MSGRIIVGQKRFQFIMEGTVPPSLEADEVAARAWIQGAISWHILLAGFVDDTHILFKNADITDPSGPKKM